MDRKHKDSMTMARHPYRMLWLNLILGGAVMYLVMFTMIWSLGEFFNNLNTLYMAVMMAMPMGSLMLLTMGGMYPDNRTNLALHLLFALLFLMALWAVRSQAMIGDRQFLRSMIPHHSGAVLMCERAPVRDSEIAALCAEIIRSQQQEIAQMKGMLQRKQGS